MSGTKKWPTVGDLAIILLVLLLMVIGLGLCGCRSSVPMPDQCPEPEVITVDKPAPCVVPIAMLELPALPEYPPHPGHDADEEEWKAWALLVAEVTEQREALLQAHVAAWAGKVQQHNTLEPRCGQPIP